jgi:uncharacterized protein YecE (DUF72 family)
MARAYVGLSGWVYPHWRARFYPEGLPPSRWLRFVAARFPSVEVNAAFYRMQRPETFERWRAEVPREFVFAVKGSRYVTHMLKLGGGVAPVANFFAQGVLRLGAQLGPIVWQLPPMLGFSRERAEGFFARLPRDLAAAERLARRHDARLRGRCALTAADGRERPVRHALEVRHPSWICDEALRLLEDHEIALVVADTAGRYPLHEAMTAPFVYARLHGAEQLYASGYHDHEIARWAASVRRWLASGRDAYVYFDNDFEALAPRDAARLITALGGAGALAAPASRAPRGRSRTATGAASRRARA